MSTYQKGSFGYDFNLLQNKQKVILLKDEQEKSMVLISPEYQGRVMTSSANGMNGQSYGWVNHDYIESGKKNEKFNPYGGEERFWLGPEGGQFSLYHDAEGNFTADNWSVPRALDSEPFEIVMESKQRTIFEKEMKVKNHAGTEFSIGVLRQITLLSTNSVKGFLGVAVPENVQAVAYETQNTIINRNPFEWNEKTGVPSIWMLGMYPPSAEATAVIPVKNEDASEPEKLMNDDYFGKMAEDHLKTSEGTVFMKADGNARGKIGIPPKNAKNKIGSYHVDKNTLTIIQFDLPENEMKYVNSKWETQEDPFDGDAVNAYNDGPDDKGKQMGPFYELESSSPAARLGSSFLLTHHQQVFHFEGEKEALNNLSKELLGVELDTIKEAFYTLNG